MTRKIIKVKLIGDGSENDPFTVNLPNWVMKGQPDYKNKTAFVTVPEDETSNNKLDQNKIRNKYSNWANFNKEEVEVL